MPAAVHAKAGDCPGRRPVVRLEVRSVVHLEVRPVVRRDHQRRYWAAVHSVRHWAGPRPRCRGHPKAAQAAPSPLTERLDRWAPHLGIAHLNRWARYLWTARW